jgi:protein tyrosine/serine phosphatase
MTVDWSGCANHRDVGGAPTATGARVRTGALVRSGRHDRLSAAAVEAVRAGAVGRIVDLRGGGECVEHPSPFAADTCYRHVPMLPDVLGYDPPPDSYGPMLDHCGDRVAAAYRTVADAPAGCVVVHCHAGRDRTGVLVALLLGTAGVVPDAIAADYARSADADPQTMANTLTHLDHRYGGVLAYLRAIRVDPAHADAVRHRLLG